MRRIGLLLLAALLLAIPARAEVRWVDFDLTAEAMDRALTLSEESREREQPQDWIGLLAFAAARCGGSPSSRDVVSAYHSLQSGASPRTLLGGNDAAFRCYREAYGAVLGGLAGRYAVRVNGEWKPAWGIKAFSPIAAGWPYTHGPDFGAARSYGCRRPHLGHDMMGTAGTPIVAVEGGTVEALGWNRYGGWHVGIRTADRKRYYYYAHLQKDAPYAPGLAEGETVQAGQVLGFMGRTGCSHQENVENIDVVHLHFGIQLIFTEDQKDGEIWIDPYEITRLLDRHRSSVLYNEASGRWERIYEFRNLDEAGGIPR